MAELNVFELTNMELRKSEKVDSKKVVKKSVKESVKRTRKARKPFSIPVGKIKLESIKHFHEAEGDEVIDVVADYTPDDDVVLVIDPEIDEVPADTEQAVEDAEELIGQHICKCAICGANYVCDAEIDEELEIEEECPVCGETGEQIVVGIITPTEELSDDDKEDITDVDVEDTADVDVDVDIDEDGEDDVDTDGDAYIDSDEDFDECVKRSRMRTMKRRAESVRRKPMAKRTGVAEAKKSMMARKPMARPMASRKAVATEGYSFDDVTFSRMLTKFAKENYSNVKFVKITEGTISKTGRITLEGTVTTTKGVKRSIKFVSERVKFGPKMSLSFREHGPFTESAKNVGTTFTVECVCRGKQILPAFLKYSFKATESKDTYKVSGKVLSESIKTSAKPMASKSLRARKGFKK